MRIHYAKKSLCRGGEFTLFFFFAVSISVGSGELNYGVFNENKAIW